MWKKLRRSGAAWSLQTLPPSLLSIYVKVCEKMFYQSFELSKKIKNVNCPFWETFFISASMPSWAATKVLVALVVFLFHASSFRDFVIRRNRNHLTLSKTTSAVHRISWVTKSSGCHSFQEKICNRNRYTSESCNLNIRIATHDYMLQSLFTF